MVEYIAFFVSLFCLVGMLLSYITQLVIVFGRLTGRKDAFVWNFNHSHFWLALFSATTAFLWHYNFG